MSETQTYKRLDAQEKREFEKRYCHEAEGIVLAYQTDGTRHVFTHTRVICEYFGQSGKRFSVPYTRICAFNVKTYDGVDGELDFWMEGDANPTSIRSVDIAEVERHLALYVN